MAKNEFEEMDTFSDEEAPTNVVTEEVGSDSLIADSMAGQEYDWKNAPTEGRAPPRIILDGKDVVINKAVMILPRQDQPWLTSRDGSKLYKYCVFKLYYSIEGQQEFYSGVRVFKQKDDKYSHPTIMRDRQNQASQLMGLYADYKHKHINEISLNEFMNFLNSKPKAKLKTVEYNNPTTKIAMKKNMVEKFI